MTSKILQFNEKLDNVKRFLQTTERGHFDDEIINLQSVTVHLKYISKTIIGIYNHDENQRAPFNFKNVTEIIMDLITLMPNLHLNSNPSVCFTERVMTQNQLFYLFLVFFN